MAAGNPARRTGPSSPGAPGCHSLTAGIVTLVVFVGYQQLGNHVLNPVVMSRTVNVNPLLVLVSILIGSSIGDWFGGYFGAFVAALLSIPARPRCRWSSGKYGGPPRRPERWPATIPAEPSAAPGGIAPVNITRATVAFTLAESHDGLP